MNKAQLSKPIMRNIIAFCLMLLPFSGFAEVNWLFQIGGMYRNQYGSSNGLLEKASTYDASTGLFLQIPLSNSKPFFIETGLGYHRKLVISQFGEYDFRSGNFQDIINEYGAYYYGQYFDYGYRDIIELPVKFGYKLKLNEKNSFFFAAGPYAGADFNSDYYAGVNASVAFRHRSMSFGFQWQNPVFYNGPKDYYTNSFQVTIGINFRIGKINTDALLTGLNATSAVLGTMTDTYMQYQDMRNQANGDYSSDDSSYSTGSSSGSGSSSGGKGFSLSEQQAYNRDKATYERYDSELAKFFAGNAPNYDKAGAQRKMKQLREKWEKKGKSWTKVPNETR